LPEKANNTFMQRIFGKKPKYSNDSESLENTFNEEVKLQTRAGSWELVQDE